MYTLRIVHLFYVFYILKLEHFCFTICGFRKSICISFSNYFRTNLGFGVFKFYLIYSRQKSVLSWFPLKIGVFLQRVLRIVLSPGLLIGLKYSISFLSITTQACEIGRPKKTRQVSTSQ